MEARICFLVDDMVFFRPFELVHLSKALNDSSVLAYHLNLHPNVNFCHPSNKKAVCPSDIRKYKINGVQFSEKDSLAIHSMIFRRILGTQDWNYPWNLCGGIYRGSDALEIIQNVEKTKGIKGIDHPNHLEVASLLRILHLSFCSRTSFCICLGEWEHSCRRVRASE